MAITTIEILAQQTTPLNPGAPVLNPDDPGIVIDRTVLNTIRLTVPPTIDAGNVNIATILLGTQPVQQGQPMLLIRATLTSQGGAYVFGNAIFRVGPPNTTGGSNVQLVQDLSATAGQYTGTPLEFPIDHTVRFSTLVGPVNGPHRIILVAKFFEDSDVFSAA